MRTVHARLIATASVCNWKSASFEAEDDEGKTVSMETEVEGGEMRLAVEVFRRCKMPRATVAQSKSSLGAEDLSGSHSGSTEFMLESLDPCLCDVDGRLEAVVEVARLEGWTLPLHTAPFISRSTTEKKSSCPVPAWFPAEGMPLVSLFKLPLESASKFLNLKSLIVVKIACRSKVTLMALVSR